MFVVLYFMPWFTNHPTLIWTNFGYMSTCGKMALTVGTMYCIFDVFAARFQSFSVMEGSSYMKALGLLILTSRIPIETPLNPSANTVPSNCKQ